MLLWPVSFSGYPWLIIPVVMPFSPSMNLFLQPYLVSSIFHRVSRTFMVTLAPPHVHICNFAAQSGVTLFQHLHTPPQPSLLLGSHNVAPSLPWTYNKTENLSLADISSASHFTHIISEVPPSDPDVIQSWRLLREIPAFHRIVFNKNILMKRPHRLQRRAFDIFSIEHKNQLWIYERS